MKEIFITDRINYDGSQLRSHWIYEKHGVRGDAIAAFIGACDVSLKHMVDLEDVLGNDKIYSENMLHFIVEHFDISLHEIVLRQRLLICIIKDILESSVPDLKLKREGDDLYENTGKLTISIATKSPVSGLIHAGINIINDNTPVETKSLKDFGIEPKVLAEEVLKQYCNELAQIDLAISKVRWVG